MIKEICTECSRAAIKCFIIAEKRNIYCNTCYYRNYRNKTLPEGRRKITGRGQRFPNLRSRTFCIIGGESITSSEVRELLKNRGTD